MTTVLEVRDLRKSYLMGGQTLTALDGVNLTVEQGEFVAVMGPSGSGKSTLLNLIGGLDHADSGEVIIGSERLSRLEDHELSLLRRRKIGFVFQFFNLIATLNAAENVALPLLLDGQRLSDHRAKVEQLLARVGLAERSGHRPDQLSGGQQQRVAIARALVAQPELVLADEPTGNLDSRSGSAVLELLRDLGQREQVTVVMVTHDPRAASFADRVIFLKDGAIVRELRPGGGAQPIIDAMAQLEG